MNCCFKVAEEIKQKMFVMQRDKSVMSGILNEAMEKMRRLEKENNECFNEASEFMVMLPEGQKKYQ